MANLIAVLVARRGALGPDVRRQGLADGGGRLTAYTSTATHGCVSRALDLAGLGTDALRLIAIDDDHRLDLAALRAAVRADRLAGYRPFLVVGTAGSVNVGACDDLSAIADFCAAESLWFHVDGAFGALAILAPDLAPRLHGIQRADSLAFDFHKWGHVPYDAGFILVRDGTLHRDTFAAPAAYLRRETRGLAAGEPWFCDYGPDLSRGFRALKAWFTLQVHGTNALGRAISDNCALARTLKQRIESEPRLELLAPVALNIVCFGVACADADRVNAAVVVDLHESGLAAPSLTMVRDRVAIRAAIVNHRTTHHDIDTLVAATLRFAARHGGP
jgi:glutamate/tyrosine decarboxylase-like PLP-dependent enzyme